MNAYVYLIVLGTIFGLLPILWKAKGVHIFLLLIAGEALSVLAGPDVAKFVKQNVHTSLAVESIVEGVLLLLPPLLGLLISKKSVKKKRALYHVVPSLAAGALAYVWLIQVLPNDIYKDLGKAAVTQQIFRYQGLAIGLSIVSSLLLMIAERPKPEEGDKKKK